jgi:dihydrodipicolinate synthase/N-acetylneuraminate lyase
VAPCDSPPVIERIQARRRITGMAAVLLPIADDGSIDWDALGAHVERTAAAGLTPALNMDTGFVSLLDPETRTRVLGVAKSTGAAFVAGAFVDDQPGAGFDEGAHLGAVEEVAAHGGTPVVFPSHGLAGLTEPDWLAAHERVGERCGRFLAFELGEMFLPQGRILSLDGYRALLGITACVGAKHSSLRRGAEWERLALRDEVRDDFLVLTGNDLAIDMVMWGSDYLLGLATFAPDWFAERDRFWEAGDARFFELNDALQALGSFAFRAPVPAYRHDAAMFLRLRGWLAGDRTHPASPARPDGDREVLAELLERGRAAAAN